MQHTVFRVDLRIPVFVLAKTKVPKVLDSLQSQSRPQSLRSLWSVDYKERKSTQATRKISTSFYEII